MLSLRPLKGGSAVLRYTKCVKLVQFSQQFRLEKHLINFGKPEFIRNRGGFLIPLFTS